MPTKTIRFIRGEENQEKPQIVGMATAAVCTYGGDPDPVEVVEGISYPLRMDYCGLCTMPPEVNHWYSPNAASCMHYR